MNELFPEPNFYPWQAEFFQQWMNSRKRQGHALLLHGAPGLGKHKLAQAMAASLLCEQPDETSGACGKCKPCHLLAARTHPDITNIEPPEEGKVIAVDQVRALADFLVLRPHTADHKIALIQPAEAMNINAANSLLKMLEEPPAGTMLILVSHAPHLLPVTIRSRCISVPAPKANKTIASQWLSAQGVKTETSLLLDLTHNAPLTTLEWAQNDILAQRQQWLEDVSGLLTQDAAGAVDCSRRWKQTGFDKPLLWFHGLVADLIRQAMGATSKSLNNPDIRERLQELGKQINLMKLLNFFNKLSKLRHQLGTPLDAQLLTEDLFFHWQDVAETKKQ